MGGERKITRRRRSPRPEAVVDAVTRGQMFRAILDELGILAADFAEATGIARSTIQGYIAGRLDIARMSGATVDRFLTGLAISDDVARELFAISPADFPQWRSTRPPPLGSGPSRQDERVIEHVTLNDPLFGEMSLPADSTVFYAPGGVGRFYLMQLENGQLFVVRAAKPSPGTRILGALINVTFDPEPAMTQLRRDPARA